MGSRKRGSSIGCFLLISVSIPSNADANIKTTQVVSEVFSSIFKAGTQNPAVLGEGTIYAKDAVSIIIWWKTGVWILRQTQGFRPGLFEHAMGFSRAATEESSRLLRITSANAHNSQALVPNRPLLHPLRFQSPMMRQSSRTDLPSPSQLHPSFLTGIYSGGGPVASIYTTGTSRFGG